MKRTALLPVMIFLNFCAHAQKDTCYAGVYVTMEDMVSNNLSYKINTREDGYKFNFPIVADLRLEIKIITPGKTFKFPQGSVYGYEECGRKYRYSPGGTLYAIEDFYKIEENSHLVIYTSVFNGGDEYYYSLDIGSPIKRLNMRNLKDDFCDQTGFMYALKKIRRKGVKGGLAKTDDNGNFMINKIYGETIEDNGGE